MFLYHLSLYHLSLYLRMRMRLLLMRMRMRMRMRTRLLIKSNRNSRQALNSAESFFDCGGVVGEGDYGGEQHDLGWLFYERVERRMGWGMRDEGCVRGGKENCDICRVMSTGMGFSRRWTR